MEINEEKTVDMLSTESVSILTRKVLIDGEVKSQVERIIDEPILIPYPEEKNC